jgi:bifunctional UDP-N-acetylglucosamine pyrophosphorylase/glucosamine-1-phosphate N-acetyltransferase
MKDTSVIILASGKGTRMGYKTPKPLLKIGGISFIQQILNRIDAIESISEVIITEPQDTVISNTKPLSKHPLRYATQYIPNGPATALEAALSKVAPKNKNILLLLGDAPLIQTSNIIKLLSEHASSNDAMTILVGKSQTNIPFGKVSFTNGVYNFVEPGQTINTSTLYSLGPLLFSRASITKHINSLIEMQGEEKRIEPIVALYNTKNMTVGVCEVSINNTLHWNINNRNDLYRARAL